MLDLAKLAPEVEKIIFFVNGTGEHDFSEIPYTQVRLYAVDVVNRQDYTVLSEFNVSAKAEYKGRNGSDWWEVGIPGYRRPATYPHHHRNPRAAQP